ncbi:unnamed protein product [Linum trigynum]|uniref:Uncharacterized protein n=1 Tax=Linum trigynum TaxID=586398 RepID=A0AAV2DV17_9ROSI
MSSSRLSDLSWAELREQARRIGRRWIPEELPIAQEEVMPKETDRELPLQLSNLSWAELRERARRIGRRWSSEELPTGCASTGEEQPLVVQVDSHGDIERRAEQPDMKEVLAIEPPATEELPNVTNKQQQLPTTLVTMTATSSSTSLAAIEQPSKATEATVAIVSEEEGERTNASKEETRTKGPERRSVTARVANWRYQKKGSTRVHLLANGGTTEKAAQVLSGAAPSSPAIRLTVRSWPGKGSRKKIESPEKEPKMRSASGWSSKRRVALVAAGDIEEGDEEEGEGGWWRRGFHGFRQTLVA